MTTTSVKRYLSLILAVVFIILFQDSFVHAQKADRSGPPELGPPSALKLPPVQHFALSNGLKVVLMEKHELPLIQIELIVMAGSAMDPEGKQGLASMTSALMEDGAGTRNALQFADAIDYLGADISSVAGQHTSAVVLHTPFSKLDSALALFSDVAQRPLFPAEELERLRKERLTSLQQWHDRPSSIASVIFNRTLYGTKHPYGIPSIGDEKSIRAFRVEDLKSFHEQYFGSNNTTIIVVGDVTKSSIEPKLEMAFGRWKSASKPQVLWPAIQQVKEKKIILVDKPGAAQSEIRIGRIGVQRLTEDYFPLIVMNTILGGSFTSRLNQNLREQHGYSYGAGSPFSFRPLPGPFVASAAVQTAVTDKALVEFVKELTNILQPVSDEELTRATNYLALGYPDNFQSIAQIAREIEDLIMYNLPDDYLNNYIRNVLAVTKEDVNRVAKKYIDPEKSSIIIVGDRAQIEKSVSALNLAPVEYMSVDDVLGKAPVLDSEK